MDCSHCRNLLSPYIDGELTDSQQRSLEEHIAACPDCRAELDELRRVDTITHQTIELNRPSADFPERVLSHLPPQTASSRWQGPAAVFLFLLLAVVVGAAIVFSLLREGPSDGRVVLFQSMLPEDDIPREIKVPFDITWPEPAGLKGPGVILAFRGRISVRSDDASHLRITPSAGSLIWIRCGGENQVRVSLPRGGYAGPVKQAVFDFTAEPAGIYNLWQEPLNTSGGPLPPGFVRRDGADTETDAFDLALKCSPLARFFPEKAALPLDWAPADPGRGPRRAGLPLKEKASPELLGEVPPHMPLSLVLSSSGDTIMVPEPREPEPPLRSVGAAWSQMEILAALPGLEGRCIGLGYNGDVYFRLDGSSKFSGVVSQPGPGTLLHRPLLGFFLLHTKTGIAVMDIPGANVRWRERRLTDVAGTATDGKGNVWSAQRDGTLTLLDGKTGDKLRSYGPVGQGFVSAPVRTAPGLLSLGEEGRLLLVPDDAPSRIMDYNTGGAIDCFTAARDGTVYFHRQDRWFRTRGMEGFVELGKGGSEALLLSDGMLAAGGPQGLALLPEGRNLVFEGPGTLMAGTEGIYWVTTGGRIYRLPYR